MIVIIWIIFLWFCATSFKHSTHILQQNHYQLDRYRIWLKQFVFHNKNVMLRWMLLFLPIYGLLIVSNSVDIITLYLLMLFVYGFLFFQYERQKEYVVPLQYTARVKRFLIVQISVVTIGIVLCSIWLSKKGFIAITPIIYAFPWLSVWISYGICYPMEKAIQFYYIKDAKQRLFSNSNLRKIAITGSYGKTSTKHIVKKLIDEEYYTCMSPKSYNNKMGLTITIRTILQPLHEVFIAEMGSDHKGEIHELTNFIQPEIGIVTAIGPQHIETFHTMHTIVEEKMSLIESLPVYGTAILNYDNAYIRNYSIKNKCNKITYGIHYEDVDIRAIDIQYHNDGTTFTVRDQERAYTVSTKLLGEHNVLNILAGICLAKTLKVKEDQIQNAIRRIPFVEHRLQIKKEKTYTLLDDSFNSNPEGAKYALDVLHKMPNCKWIITPGFLDMANEKEKAHITYAKQIAKVCDIVILIGKKHTKDIYETLLEEGFQKDAIYTFEKMQDALIKVDNECRNQEIILIENDFPDAFQY